jgi:hypothetical protein
MSCLRTTRNGVTLTDNHHVFTKYAYNCITYIETAPKNILCVGLFPGRCEAENTIWWVIVVDVSTWYRSSTSSITAGRKTRPCHQDARIAEGDGNVVSMAERRSPLGRYRIRKESSCIRKGLISQIVLGEVKGLSIHYIKMTCIHIWDKEEQSV